MKTIKKFSLGEKISLISVIIAILSLFLSWVSLESANLSGINQEGYYLLVFFLYPTVAMIRKCSYKPMTGFVSGILAVLFTMFFIQSKTVYISGDKINVSGIGMYVFLISSVGFTVGHFLIMRNIKHI